MEGMSWIWLDKVFFQTSVSFPQLSENRHCLTIGTNTLIKIKDDQNVLRTGGGWATFGLYLGVRTYNTHQ